MNVKATPSFKQIKQNDLKPPINKEIPQPSWLEKVVEGIFVPVTSTFFELLLLGFATFFPAYIFKIEHPFIIYAQMVTLSVTVAFFQGCRSPGYFSYIKDSIEKYHSLFGAISVIPLNLVTLLYFSLYNQNPALEIAEIKQVQMFAVFLVVLNFGVGIWGSQKQYQAIKQNGSEGPMGLFYLSVGLTLISWFIIYFILNFILN